MYKDLGAIAIFVAVVEEGGFSKAAQKLGVTNSVISHHVTKLEKRLGVTLLYRSTRQVTLSDQGRAFYSATSGALVSIEEAAVNLRAEGSDPSGSLHIAMPSFVPDSRVQERLWDFTHRYANVDLKISFSDDRKELIFEKFDIAFRLGPLESSSMMSRKIVDVELILVASPGLVAKNKKIQKPNDVTNMDCISFKQMNWSVTLFKGNASEKIHMTNKRIEVDNIYAARDAAVAGLGMIPLPLGLCERELTEQKLERVLPEWDISTIPLHVVWHNKARRNSLTRLLLSFLTDDI